MPTLFLFIFRLGPLITCWCMRMEAKNSYFKRVAQIGNYRNVPYSVSSRHQRLLCAYLQGPFFTYEDMECGPCMSINSPCTCTLYTGTWSSLINTR